MEIKSKYNELFIQLFIIAVASLLFIPYAGGMHLFDWDEINFAESAREMIASNDYLNVQIHFRPFWEKPPLFIWLQVISMKVFGINEFAARFPNAVCGILTLLLIYHIGRRLYGSSFGLWWVIAYIGSFLPQFYFRSGIIDPWFNLLIFVAIYFFIQLHRVDKETTLRHRIVNSILWGVFTGLAILTKGPTALLIIGLVAGIAYLPSFFQILKIRKSASDRKPQFQLRWNDLLIFFFFAILIGGSWFIIQMFNGNSAVIWQFIDYQIRLLIIPDAGHGGNWSYHFIVLLIGVFPASIFALAGMRISKDRTLLQSQFQRIMIILFWVVLILFTIVTTKIVHYSSLCYLPLTFFAAIAIRKMLSGQLRWRGWLTWLISLLGGVYAILIIILPIFIRFKDKIIQSGIIKDDFAVANLQAQVYWSGYESYIGVFLIAGMITAFVLKKKSIQNGLRVLFGTTIIFFWSVIIIFPFKVEQYSQRAVIEFYEKISKEECYVQNLGFFSYAPWYYTKIQPNDKYNDSHYVMWLLIGNLDKQAYFVFKEPNYEESKQYFPALKELYRKNGFVFLVRLPEKYKFNIPL